MAVLEGYLNVNPVNIGGPVVALVDHTALSADSEDASAFVEQGASGTGQISTYVVKEGDTIGEIAQKFGVSTNTIRWANNLSGSTLKVGQELAILPITGVKHTVKSGDTLVSIAKKYGASQDDIISYNGLSSDAKLAVGQEIIIPDGELVSTSGAAAVATKAVSGLKDATGYYLRPIVGGVRTQGIHGHNGVDLASSYGTPILAAADGTVLISKNGGWNGGYGSYIVLQHDNGTQTLYGHLSAALVSVGDHVEQGQVIGKMGNTGQVTGPTGIHLHFEVRGAKNPF
jgi:murein DD-endopeptidase MepM/ murein hydrolase activator NlpD